MLCSFDGHGEGLRFCGGFVGDSVGVDGRSAMDGEDGDCGRPPPNVDEGDSGLRKGDVRGEPKERGEGLYVDGTD